MPESTCTVTVYGANACDRTRRSLRLLRRLHVRCHYVNVDVDPDARARMVSRGPGDGRTPSIDLGLGGPPLVAPDNEVLMAALVEREMLTVEEAEERLGLQNIGDVERLARTTAGLVLVAAGSAAPRRFRTALRGLGLALAATGVVGWSPAYYLAGVTSIGGPLDRPDETDRREWVVPRAQLAAGGFADSWRAEDKAL